MDWKRLGQSWQAMFAELWQEFYLALDQFKAAFLVMGVYGVFAVVFFLYVTVLSVPIVALAVLLLVKERGLARSNDEDEQFWWTLLNGVISLGGYVLVLIVLGWLAAIGILCTHILGIVLYSTIPEPKLPPPPTPPQLPPGNTPSYGQDVSPPANYGEQTTDLSRNK